MTNNRELSPSAEPGKRRCFPLIEKCSYIAEKIRTLTVNVKAKIVANDQKKSEGAPDFRVYAGAAELGAAWKAKTKGDEPKEYLRVQLDDPSFPEPVRAALIEEDGAAFLVWNRREG